MGIDANDGRTPAELLNDRVLLLLAIASGEESGRVDTFRLMKIPFAVQHEMNAKFTKTFSYRFYREGHGPISKSIYQDRDALRDAGLLSGNDAGYHLTKLGDRLTGLLRGQMLAENAGILKAVESTAKRFAAAPNWETIKEEVYALDARADAVGSTIGDASQYVDVLEKLPDDECQDQVKMPESAEDTMILALSLTAEEIAAASVDSGLTLDEVFA